jgi:hypothetical protein
MRRPFSFVGEYNKHADGSFIKFETRPVQANERLRFRDSGIAILAPVLGWILLGARFRADELSPLAWVGLLPIASALKRRTRVIETYVGGYLGGEGAPMRAAPA